MVCFDFHVSSIEGGDLCNAEDLEEVAENDEKLDGSFVRGGLAIF